MSVPVTVRFYFTLLQPVGLSVAAAALQCREAESGPWSKKGCYQTKWDLLGDLSPVVPRGDCPAGEVQLIFSHFNDCVSGISCCTGRRWGTIDAREPGGEFANWTLVPALLFTVSCSSDLSWQSQQAPVCGSSRAPARAGAAPWQSLCAGWAGPPGILCVCVCSSVSKEIRLGTANLFFSLRESCLTLMTSCNSSFLEMNENLPNNKSNKKGRKKPSLIIISLKS